MTGSGAPEFLYVTGATEPLFASLHRPAASSQRDTAVVIVPPFGWEEVSAYRSLRLWAQLLAEAGYPTAQISLPSTGDSAGTASDPHRVEAWVSAFVASAGWVRGASGASRVAAIGLGLGGLVTVLGCADGADVDDLILWAVPARGRAIVRQLRAISRLEAARFAQDPTVSPGLAPGEIEAGGFRLTAETVTRLDAVRLDEVSLPHRADRRALVFGPDGRSADAGLCDALRRSDVPVTAVRTRGFGALTSHPQETRLPHTAIGQVRAWLDAASHVVAAPPRLDALQPHQLHLSLPDGTAVTETPMRIVSGSRTLFGVLSEPADTSPPAFCVVLLNAGAVRHIGPNRMWVEAARRWASRGIPTLRLDVDGIGDADGAQAPYRSDAALYVPHLVAQVRSALDHLQDKRVADHFVVGGLCAGAFWAFHAAIQDPRVTAAMLLNPRALIWDDELGPARDLRTIVEGRYSVATLRQRATVSRLKALLGWLLTAPFRRLTGRVRGGAHASLRDIDMAIEQFAQTGKPALLVFSEHEPLDRELRESGHLTRLASLPNLQLERVAVPDHTMRPHWAQQRAHELLDAALERQLEAAASPVVPG